MNYLGLFRCAVGNLEENARLDLVDALTAGGSRINVQHIAEIPYPLDPQDMAVAANEDIGGIDGQQRGHGTIPLSRPAADVRHPEPQAGDLDPKMLFRANAYRSPVDIAPYGVHGRDLLQPIENLRCADIARVENEIDVAQVFRQRGVKVTVRVGKEP